MGAGGLTRVLPPPTPPQKEELEAKVREAVGRREQVRPPPLTRLGVPSRGAGV